MLSAFDSSMSQELKTPVPENENYCHNCNCKISNYKEHIKSKEHNDLCNQSEIFQEIDIFLAETFGS